MKEVRNLPASVHDRLINLAKQRGQPFQVLFYTYSLERFLYRLFRSVYANDFVLKGGMMFFGWGIPLRRLTRDIDVQGTVNNSPRLLEAIVKDICSQQVEPDGLRFDPDSVRSEQIMNEADYQGVRVYFIGYLGRANIHLHLDVSFANVITPEVILVDYPSLLGLPEFAVRGYPYETAIAEKLQAMVSLGNINDRMKDFYDIWLLSQQANIPGNTLVRAIQATFRKRNTPLPQSIPEALTPEFGRSRQPDWESFLKRSALNSLEHPSFEEIVSVLRALLEPVLQAAVEGSTFDMVWKDGGPWSL